MTTHETIIDNIGHSDVLAEDGYATYRGETIPAFRATAVVARPIDGRTEDGRLVYVAEPYGSEDGGPLFVVDYNDNR
jgi:hypothetical protein